MTPKSKLHYIPICVVVLRVESIATKVRGPNEITLIYIRVMISKTCN